MKKLILGTLLVSLLVFAFSCKKDSSDEGSTVESFSAKVQGNLWTASSVEALHSVAMNTTSIAAMNMNTSELATIIFKGNTVGTYKVDGNIDNTMVLLVGGKSITSNACSNPVGEIVITKYDLSAMKISGTFKFQGKSLMDNVTLNITEGKFENIKLMNN